MATLYFYGASDSNWQTLGNWWQDEGLTIPATGLPTSSDSVVLSVSDVLNNSGSEPTVVNFTAISCYLSIPLTVTGIASFESSTNSSTLTAASAVFNEYSTNTGTINITETDCTFNGNSYSDGSINGNCTFNDSSYNYNNITGSCIFNDSSRFDGPGTISGNCTFNDSSYNNGLITGDCTFNNNSYNDGDGTVSGDATFNDSSYCGSSGTVIGDVVCNDTSSYRSNIDGSFPENLAPASITCYDSSYTEIGYGASRETTCNYYNTSYNKGHIANSVFHDNSYNFADFPNGIYGYLLDSATFNDNSINYGFLGGPISRTPTVIFNDYSMNNGPADSPNYPVSVTFNHNSYNTYNIIVSTITFNNNSYSSSAVSAVDCNINGPKPIIIGAFNNETVVAPYYGNARIQIPSFSRAGLGVNGSNILGVI